MNIFEDELKRLNLEDWIFIIFIFIALMNIFGDQLLKKYVKQNNIKDLKNADKIFLATLTITLIAYLYFVIRNYYFYKKDIKNRNLLTVKLVGSLFLVIGILCLIYFQLKDPKFIGIPA